MSVIVRALKAAWDEISKPPSFVKGDEFEDFIRKNLFPVDHYDLVNKTHDFASNRSDYVETSKEPDFKFRSRKSGKEFFVEAKYRSGFYKGAVEWCKSYQLKRYKAIDKETPVYVAIGVGTNPSSPEQVFLIPMRNIRYTRLFESFLRQFEVQADVPGVSKLDTIM